MYMSKINAAHLSFNNVTKLFRILSEEALRRSEERGYYAKRPIKDPKTQLNFFNSTLLDEECQNIEHFKQKLLELENNEISPVFISSENSLFKRICKVAILSFSTLKDSENDSEKSTDTEKKKKKTKVPEVIDVSKLDFRVGRIINVKKHPDADSLYVEDVDIGEAQPRVVVSGLVNHVSQEEMTNRLVVLLCNVKPAKMRGITSEAMVMCASSPEKVEILIPPENSIPGDRIVFEGYSENPNPMENLIKKKIFDQIQPDLHTSEDKVATYKDVPFTIPGKGIVVAPTMKHSAIK